VRWERGAGFLPCASYQTQLLPRKSSSFDGVSGESNSLPVFFICILFFSLPIAACLPLLADVFYVLVAGEPRLQTAVRCLVPAFSAEIAFVPVVYASNRGKNM